MDLKNEFQWGIVKFGGANFQDLGNHFLIIFSIGLILYFAIFVDERSQPIVNNAHRKEDSTDSSMITSTISKEIDIVVTTESETSEGHSFSSPQKADPPEKTISPKEEEIPKTPRVGRKSIQPIPSTAERKSLRVRKTPEKYKP